MPLSSTSSSWCFCGSSASAACPDVTTFDFLLLLLVAQAAQQALLGDDFSLTNAVLVALTLLAAERVSDYLQWRFPRVAKVTQSVPVVLVENGRLIPERLAKSHIDEDDILNAARKTQGLSRMDQIDYAVLERSGGISILPKSTTQ